MNPNDQIPVAAYRRNVDRLLRKANDYHACCSASEVKDWKEVTQRVLDEILMQKCTRATACDRESHDSAVISVRKFLGAADQRIAGYEASASSKANNQPSARPALRLIQGGRMH